MVITEISVDELYKNDDKLKKQDVADVMEWLKKQPHLPKASELLVALFLHSCYYSIEKAKVTLDTYFTIKTHCSDIFGGRTLNDPFLKITVDSVVTTPLPKRTPSGDILVFGKLIDFAAENYHLPSTFKLFDITTLLNFHQFGPGNGLHVVVSMQGCTWGHVMKLNPLMLKKFFLYLQEGMPIRLKSFHFIEIVPFADKILAIIKPFLKNQSIITLHPGIDPIFKIFPKEIFPEEYGGMCESIQKMSEQTKKLLTENEDFLKDQDAQIVDETKRPGKSKSVGDIFGVEGSFKKLMID